MKRKAFVVDTNVLIVSNNCETHADAECRLNSVRFLRMIQNEGLLVLDEQGEILREYRRKCRPSGRPGTGDRFFKWARDNQGNPDRFEKVSITQRQDDTDDYEEFPDDPAWKSFDRSDRKFVAAALKSKNKPTILNATDTDWWEFREPLQELDIKVEFLCPHMMPHS